VLAFAFGLDLRGLVWLSHAVIRLPVTSYGSPKCFPSLPKASEAWLRQRQAEDKAEDTQRMRGGYKLGLGYGRGSYLGCGISLRIRPRIRLGKA
jgi:hypothetical protein